MHSGVGFRFGFLGALGRFCVWCDFGSLLDLGGDFLLWVPCFRFVLGFGENPGGLD